MSVPMLRVIFGVLLLVIAVALAGADGVRWMQTGALEFQSLGAVWFKLDRESLNLAQAVVERRLWAPLWDPGVTSILLLPAWVLPGALSLLLFLSASRVKPDTTVFGKIVK